MEDALRGNVLDERDTGAGQRDALGIFRSLGIRAWAFIGVAVVFGICVWAMGFIWPAVELLLAGVVMGFVCSPLTNFLEDHGVKRTIGALVALLVLVAVIVGVLLLLMPPFVEQLAEVLRKVPTYVIKVRTSVDGFWRRYGNAENADVQQSVNQAVNAISGIGIKTSSELAERLSSGLMSSAVSFVNGFATLCLGLVLAYWFAKDYPVIAREFITIAGPRHERGLSVLLAVITSVFDGLLSWVFLALVGHPYAGLAAILVGVLHFVPVIGEWVAVAFAVLLALFESPMLAIVALLGSVVIQSLTDNVVSPLVMRSAVKIHPALSLVGLFIGNSLGGVLGMLLAVPLTAAIKSVFVYYFESRSGRQLVSYDGALFQGTPFHDAHGGVEPAFDALDDDRFFMGSRLVDGAQTEAPVADEPPKAHAHVLADALSDAVERARARRGGRTRDQESGHDKDLRK